MKRELNIPNEIYIFVAIFGFMALIIGFIAGLLISIPTENDFHSEVIEQKIILENTNMYEDWKVIEVNCSEGVEYTIHRNSVYLSTWGLKSNITYGECWIKRLIDIKD